MSYFTDYLRNRRQQGLPMVPLSEGQQPMQPTLQGSQKMRQQSPLYNAGQFYSITPTAQPAEEQPRVDTSNAIGSLADLLGPTPAEREAQQARLERGRQQMTMWTGLIDGLRQLGNLYYTAQGARPQQFSDPYKMVDETYQREAKRLDDLTAYRRAYANQLYNLQRQMGQDEMAKERHQATLDWYKNRDEQNARKVDIQQFKAEADAAYKEATLEQKEQILDIRRRVADNQISYRDGMLEVARIRANKSGGSGKGQQGAVETVTTYSRDADGNKVRTTRKQPVGSGSDNNAPPSRRRKDNSNAAPSRRGRK